MGTATIERIHRPAASSPRTWLDTHFYFLMSLVVVVPVVYGFSFTIGNNLLHPAVPRPRILYFHAAVFSGWLAFFIVQSSLVRLRKVRWHRRVGWLGVALGVLIVALGVSTSIAMGHFDRETLHTSDAERGLIVPLFDMVCFTSTFFPAVLWRRTPEVHRRLMLIATCVLTAAGFGRFPERILPSYLFYGGVDALILMGVARDLIVSRRVHRVYATALPCLLVGQAVVTYIAYHDVQPWLTIARTLLG